MPKVRATSPALGLNTCECIKTAKLLLRQIRSHGCFAASQQVLIWNSVDCRQDAMGLALPKEDPAHLQNGFPVGIKERQLAATARV